MGTGNLLLSEKYKAFLRCDAAAEFMEGTTASGKTTVGLFKFMLKVAQSPKKLHIIAADDTGAAEKNIINKDLGILDDFGILVKYNGNGGNGYKMPHILYHAPGGDKIIFVIGYGNKRKWKDALGGQYGCLYIDEINTADIDFVREASMRSDYILGTLNPDDPSLPVYKEYVNCSRPLPEWAADTPQEILNELTEEPKPGWVHWFFSFADNLGLPKEKLDKIIANTPKGTKLWKNKIKGLRGKASGLVFCNFSRKHHVISEREAKKFLTSGAGNRTEEYFVIFTSGLDTSYSSQSKDTIAMSFSGITNKGRYILLDERCYNNALLDKPIAPSDTAINYVDFLERNRKEWGMARQVFVDSADQATLTELAKYKRSHAECLYIFNGSYKKIQIVDRIIMQLGWMNYDMENGIAPDFYVVDSCVNYIREMETYSWKEDKDNEPEDGNDHMVNSVQYGFIPYREKIGANRDEGGR